MSSLRILCNRVCQDTTLARGPGGATAKFMPGLCADFVLGKRSAAAASLAALAFALWQASSERRKRLQGRADVDCI